MMGEKVGAVIVLKPDHQTDVREILEFTAERIADFKVPQFAVIRKELLPRNPGGKILKKRLRDEVAWGEAVR
jgi:acyl-CoA synthetase (AMP-forming)/AMP-acid ligase II